MADERHHLEKLILPEEEALAHVDNGTGRTSPYPDPSYAYQEKLDEGGFAYLREQWRRIHKHKWMIFFLALIITTVVTIQAFREKSIYRATTTIELDKPTRTVFRSGDTTIESDDAEHPYFTSIAMKTSIRLLKSRPVLEDVVAALKLDQNTRFLEVTSRRSVLESARAVLTRVKSGKSDSSGPGFVETPPTDSTDLTARSPEESARLAPYVGVLAGNISGTQIEDTRMLLISVDHTDPALAAAIAKTVATVFMETSYKNRTTRFKSTSDWLDRKTRELRAQVEESELKMANFASSNNMISTGDTKENLTVEKLSNMYGQVLKAQMESILKESLYDEVRQGRVAQLPEAYADPKTAALRASLEALTIQAAQYAGRFGAENPRVVDLNKQVVALQKQLDESRGTLEGRLKADYDRAKREEKALNDAFVTARGDAVHQNSAVIQYGMLKQQVEISKGIYQSFLSQSTHADLQKAEQGNNSRVIEPAFVPSAPVGPDRFRTILIGLLASLGLGVAIALLIEYFNNTVKTVEDVSRYALLPTLGIIPVISGRKTRMFANGNRGATPKLISLAQEEPPSQQLSARLSRRLRGGPVSTTSLAEAYRGLRTSILLSAAGHAPKTMLFTSSQPSEGKTTTTVNTAISLAHLGASVLIIDADLRRPSTHRVFKVSHTPGLSTFLSREVELDGLVQDLSIPNLSLLPCGPLPPNPSELISSVKMKELLRIASGRYDHVLIDSPPLINVSDALILSTLVDGVILVVQGGRTSRGIVRRARMELTNVGAKIFGVVLNNVDLKRDGYYDAYYYSRYYSADYHSDREAEQASNNGD